MLFIYSAIYSTEQLLNSKFLLKLKIFMVQMQAKDFVAFLRFYLSLCHYFKCELIYGKRQSEKKRKQTVVYVELGNNSTVHTQQMHRHTILLTSTVCIVWFEAAFLPPLARSVSSTVKRCLQQTFFLLYIRMYNRFYLVETVFFRMTFFSFSLCLALRFAHHSGILRDFL